MALPPSSTRKIKDASTKVAPSASSLPLSTEAPQAVNIICELREGSLTIGVINAARKEFKTGSQGFYGQGKIIIDGKAYQGQVQLVLIGSKNAGE